MKLSTEYIIKLTKDEAMGLKKVLGNQSGNSCTNLGIAPDISASLSGLFDLLPEEDED